MLSQKSFSGSARRLSLLFISPPCDSDLTSPAARRGICCAIPNVNMTVSRLNQFLTPQIRPQLDRFLLALANRGWRPSPPRVPKNCIPLPCEVVGHEEFSWFSAHRVFKFFLPERSPSASTRVRFLTYRIMLRAIWQLGDELQRCGAMAQLAMVYARETLAEATALPKDSSSLLAVMNWNFDLFYLCLLRGFEMACRLRYCQGPKCKHPFFLQAETRRSTAALSAPCRQSERE
jgi:hypothetical protein